MTLAAVDVAGVFEYFGVVGQRARAIASSVRARP